MLMNCVFFEKMIAKQWFLVGCETKKKVFSLEKTFLWAITDSNRRPSACKADALNQLS